MLEQLLDENVFGQPLVKQTTVNALYAHFNSKKPSKALALSFHGLTGSGKFLILSINFESSEYKN